jgi:hypothetical protein
LRPIEKSLPTDKKVVAERMDVDVDVTLPVRDDEARALLIAVGAAVAISLGTNIDEAGGRFFDGGDEPLFQALRFAAEPDQHRMPAVDMAEPTRRFPRQRDYPVVVPVAASQHRDDDGTEHGHSCKRERDGGKYSPKDHRHEDERTGGRYQQRLDIDWWRAELTPDRVVAPAQRRDECGELFAKHVEDRRIV